MLLEGHSGPVVADGVEVEVEAAFPAVEANLAAAPPEALQQGDVGGAPHHKSTYDAGPHPSNNPANQRFCPVNPRNRPTRQTAEDGG